MTQPNCNRDTLICPAIQWAEAEIARLTKKCDEAHDYRVAMEHLDAKTIVMLRAEVELWKGRTFMGAEIIMENVAVIEGLRQFEQAWKEQGVEIAKLVNQLRDERAENERLKRIVSDREVEINVANSEIDRLRAEIELVSK